MTEIKQHAFLFDATRCIDCRACMVACSVENKIEMDKTRIWVAGVGLKGQFPNLTRASMVYHCMHCDEPDCLSACPVGAYTKRPDGPVLYNPKKCIGCLTCVRVCPFNVPKLTKDGVVYIEPAACQGCGICAGACPRQAIQLQNYTEEQVMAKAEAMCETK